MVSRIINVPCIWCTKVPLSPSHEWLPLSPFVPVCQQTSSSAELSQTSLSFETVGWAGRQGRNSGLYLRSTHGARKHQMQGKNHHLFHTHLANLVARWQVAQNVLCQHITCWWRIQLCLDDLAGGRHVGLQHHWQQAGYVGGQGPRQNLLGPWNDKLRHSNASLWFCDLVREPPTKKKTSDPPPKKSNPW